MVFIFLLHSTSYFILFAHLRPILRQSNIRTVFITCHEDLTEVQAFIKSFAFWLRTLQPDTDDRGNNPGILPGEIYLDTHRYSYAHFGIHTNVTWLEIARDLARNTYLNWMGKSHLNQPNAPAMEGYNYETQARLVLWNEIGATFKRGFFSKVRTGTQSPGIVIVERGQVLYKHVVKDQYRPVPQNTAELSEALLCSYDSVQGIDSVVEEGLRRFMESLQHRDTAGNVPKSELVVRSVLGKGLESEVYKCDWRGMAVAVKSYTVAAEDSEAAFNITMTSFSTEAALLMSLRHPNVLQLMGFGCEPPFRPFLVSEFMPRGSLFDVLANRSIELTPELKKSMLMDAAKGMQFLHKSGVIHQDLKSLNLLVDEDFTCKVADFGIAKVTGRGKRRRVVKEVLEAARRRRGSGNNPNDPVGSVTGQPAGGPSSGHAAGAGAGGNSGGFRSTNTSGSDRLQDSANDSDVKAHRGTIHWMPPEVMVPVPPPPTTKADVFAFGVIGWEVATRGQPWPGVAPADVCEAVVAGYRMPYPDPRNTAEQKYWRLVVDCWDQDPKKRPEFSKIVSRLSWLTIPG
ncbi:kinase-like domain-containing protein [Zopfochytrium polystomum]|nr:kinase-like domain-containing protein [Zopfochytrium polystomum]